MLVEFRRLLGHLSAYSLASMAWQAATIILLPINTLFLHPKDYGGLAVVTLIGVLVQILGQLGLPSAIFQFYMESRLANDPPASARVVSTGLVALVGATGVVVGLGWPIAPALARWLLTDGWAGIIQVYLVAFGLSNVRSVAFYLLQAEEKAKLYLALSLIELCLTVSLNIVLVAGMGWRVAGVAGAALITHGVMLALAMPILVTRLRPRLGFALSDLRRFVRYGLPLMPGQIGLVLSDRLDRTLLARIGSLDLAGVYEVSYRIGSLQDVIASAPINQAWFPYLLNHADRADIRRVHARTLTYFCAGSALLALGLGTLAQPALRLVIRNPAYWSGYTIVFVVAIAYIFKGVNSIVGSPMLMLGRTEFNLLWWAVVAGSNVLFNLALIPAFGIRGAAWATLLAFGCAAALNFWLVARRYPVPYEYGRLARIALAGLAVYLVVTAITLPDAWALLIARGLACVVLYPAGLVFMGVVQPDEWAALRTIRRERLWK